VELLVIVVLAVAGVAIFTKDKRPAPPPPGGTDLTTVGIVTAVIAAVTDAVVGEIDDYNAEQDSYWAVEHMIDAYEETRRLHHDATVAAHPFVLWDQGQRHEWRKSITKKYVGLAGLTDFNVRVQEYIEFGYADFGQPGLTWLEQQGIVRGGGGTGHARLTKAQAAEFAELAAIVEGPPILTGAAALDADQLVRWQELAARPAPFIYTESELLEIAVLHAIMAG